MGARRPCPRSRPDGAGSRPQRCLRRASAVRRYESIWRTHIKNEIGRRPIVSLGTYEVEQYLRSLKSLGLAEASVRQTRALLHRACRLARKWSGNRLSNPIDGAEMPKWALNEKGKTVRPPTLDEIGLLLTTARVFDMRLYTFLLLIAATGMRRGEACAIRWSDLDLDNGTVVIDESVVSVEGGVTVKSPKTLAGLRPNSLGDELTVQALRAHRTATQALLAAGDLELAPEHFVFASELPGVLPPHPDWFQPRCGDHPHDGWGV